MYVLRPLLLAVLLVLAGQPVQARILAPAYPSPFTLIPETGSTVDPLPSAISQAQQRVLVETNALTDGPVIAALAAAQGRGVDVRVMVDPHSASSGASLALLAGRDVWTRRGNPLFTRTGENAVVIDGSTLLLLTAPLTVQARQSQLRFLLVDHDPLDVLQAASVFYDDWERRIPNRFGHQTVLAPPDYQIDLISSINQATRSLEIMAQTLTSPAILQAVGAAVLRHVSVRVLLDPGVSPSVLSSLVALGVQPRLLSEGFSGSAVSINGAHVLIGSATLSDVSLLQQRELGVLAGDPVVNRVFNHTFDAAWASASGVQLPTPTETPLPSPTPKPVHTPHRLGTQVPTIAPTPTPPLTATPSTLILTLLYNSSVRIGGTQQVVVRTLPGAAVTITVRYPDGTTHNDGTIKGVGVADATGSFTDSWVIAPNTQPGTATANVVVSGIGQTKSATVKFSITL